MLSSEYPTAREEEEEEEKKQEEELEGNPTPLWRLFREASCEGGVCRDIAERHVISKLNQTDIKFLYDVNSETRALIKRAARSGIKLKKKFQVEEMSSISTLEFAWENRSLWPHWMGETSFCYRVAETNKLELLKWIREEKKCEWGAWTIAVAAEQGNMEMVKYCVANECPVDECACAKAASNGHLECLKYLHEEVKAPWDWRTGTWAASNGHLHILEYLVDRKYDTNGQLACTDAAENGHLDCLKYLHEVAKAPWGKYTASWAAEKGHLHILEYLVEREYDEYDEDACWYAAKHGHLDCLKYLHEVAKAPWSYRAVEAAYENDHLECLQYLLENNCPVPDGWGDWH